MTANLSFTTTELFVGVGFMIAVILGLVMLGKFYFNRKSESNLTEKYQGKQWSSPLEARNKYPDVNIFQYRGILVSLSLIMSLSLIIGLFNLTTIEKKVAIPDGASLALDVDVEIEPPRTAEPPPPPPPPPPPVIEEVPADLLVEAETVEFLDQSVDAKTEIVAPAIVEKEEKIYVAPPPPPPPPPPAEEEIFKVVEEMPRFPGCESLPSIAEKKACADKKLLEFIYQNINYPNVARENNIEGTVVIRFVVDKNGKISQAEIVREIGGGCGEEALRVVRKMNEMPVRWSPGKQRGRPVNVYFTLPVKFILKVDP